MPQRLALLLANGAYTIRAPLSRPDQTLNGMKAATEDWLSEVADALDLAVQSEMETPKDLVDPGPPLLILFSYCGHGAAGCFFPVDCGRPCGREDTFCFFEDLLFRLFKVLGRPASEFFRCDFSGETGACWLLPGIRIVVIIESCRRLLKDERYAYEATKTHVAYQKRHLLPSVQALRPDLAFQNAIWDQRRLAFLRHLGPNAPEILMALSSESTTASYDVVFLRSIVDSIDKPVRLGGILERASLETLRRTGHQQKPVVLSFGGSGERNLLEESVLARLEQHEQHVVRDLSWLIHAPPVLSEQAGMQLLDLPDEDARKATKDRFYAAALTQFWLEHGPVWDTKRSLSSYVGPFLHENLAWRLAEARRKVTCTESASASRHAVQLHAKLKEVQEFLRKELGEVQIRSVYLLKGFIFKPLDDFLTSRRLRKPPAELNPEPWQETGARMAVLPKLFWLSPVVAAGEPPQIWGEELPGQQEAVATDWPQKIQVDVEEHFTRVHTALLLCELVPVGNGNWVENSRGFILPPVWDPRRVHVAVPQRLEEELTVDHLVNYVLASTRTKKGTDPQRIQRKRSLHAAMCDREAVEKGKASCLVAECLQRLAEEKYRTDGHFILELMVKPSEVGYAPADCSVTFEADGASVRKILDLGLAGDICLRLAVKFALRFCFPADPVALKELPPLIEDHLADRARLAGLVEYLALCNSLTLLAQAEPREGDARPDVGTVDSVDTVDVNRILQKLTLPPADAAVLELLCQHCTDFCEPVSSMLLASGQLKLARKIERLKHPGWIHELPAPLSPLDHSPVGTFGIPSTSSTSLTLSILPPEVEVVLVSDAATLESACRRAKQGGVVGLDAEWKPEERRRDGRQDRQDVVNPVQLLQLAWTDVDGFCAFCLGQALDKTQQCSRWDLRPFSDQQLNYAALDAWILLALLGHIISKA
eukprot:s223_g44.t2